MSGDIVTMKSPFKFVDTVERLHAAIVAKGIKVFVVIDQQAEANAVGLSMPPATLIVFGNPKAGTPLMIANPHAGIDLPLKVFVCEPQAGEVAVMFTASSEIIKRYSLPSELLANLLPVEALILSVLRRTSDA
jgi:uncharacterized protein (DUF302 family)